MTRNSRGYNFIRFVFRFAYHWFYRKVIVTGVENIPKKKAVVFAPNHQNALMDPLAIIFTNSLQTVFLTRGDVFIPSLVPIFSYLKMLPVYRIRDGADSLKQNEDIFLKSIEILEAKMSLSLFPEALHFGKRSLRPLKKAIPRIVFQAEERNNFELEINIVPVGIFYDNYTDSGSLLQVNFGKPLDVRVYKEDYEKNPQKTMLKLKDDLYEEIKKLIIHIENLEEYENFENLRYILRKKSIEMSERKLKKKDWFVADKFTIERLEKLGPESYANLIDNLRKYLRISTKHKVDHYNIDRHPGPGFAANLITSVLLLPVFLFGLIVNLPVYLPLRIFLVKKVKDPQFHSSIKYGIGITLIPIYYLLLSLIPLFMFGGIWYLNAFLLFVVTGLTSIKYKNMLVIMLRQFRFLKFKILNRTEFNELRLIKRRMENIVQW